MSLPLDVPRESTMGTLTRSFPSLSSGLSSVLLVDVNLQRSTDTGSAVNEPRLSPAHDDQIWCVAGRVKHGVESALCGWGSCPGDRMDVLQVSTWRRVVRSKRVQRMGRRKH